MTVAVFTIANFHLFFGQIVVWGEMIYDRSEDYGFTEAVADVSSGDHPCEKCRAIAEQLAQQQPQEDEKRPNFLSQKKVDAKPLRLDFVHTLSHPSSKNISLRVKDDPYPPERFHSMSFPPPDVKA